MSPTKTETGDTTTDEKSKPPPVIDAEPITEKAEGEKKDSAAPAQTGQKPASGRKKIRSAAMGLISLIISPKGDKASADGKEEEEKEEASKKPAEATDEAKIGKDKEEKEDEVKKPAAAEATTDGLNIDKEEKEQEVKKPAEATDGAKKTDENAPPDLPPVNPMAMNNAYPMQPANFVNMEAGNSGYGGNRIMYPPPNMMEMPAYPPLNLPGPSNPSASGGKSFPEILYEIVSNPTYQDIISWLSHGQGFQIHNKQLFATRILPEYFDGAKFTSFTRRLKRWSFMRVSRGPELGAYYNKNFVRNQPELVQLMRYRLKEEGDGAILPNGQLSVAPGFLQNPNNVGKKRELPDESDVKGTIDSMRQVHGSILPQMPQQGWHAAAMYGNDGFPQLPKPSQLPKRDSSRKNDGKEKDGGGGETDGAKGTETSSSPSKKKKPKHENTMYNPSNFPPNSYGANMQFQPGMMNGGMHSGMMMNNMMGNTFGGNGMPNYPNAGMSSTFNNEERPHQMPNQMMMSTAQGGTGNVMGAPPLDTGEGNTMGNSGMMPANMPQGNMESSTTQASTTEEVTNVEI